MIGNIIDLTGQTFGLLTAISCVGRKNGQATWLCRCICGGETIQRNQSLTSKTKPTRSCGCLYKSSELMKAKMKQRKEANINPEAPLNRLFKEYSRSADRRELSFSLSKDEFKELLTGPCFWCNTEPCNVETSKGGHTLKHGGVDRLNPDKSYDKENCVSCCSPCNYLKSDLSPSDFLNRVKAVHEFSGGKTFDNGN